MKYWFAIGLSLVIVSSLTCNFAIASDNPTSTFHRLLVFNKDNKLLLVRFEGKDWWVTPGWYQNDSQSVTDGLHSLANDHGIKIDNIELRGLFSLMDGEEKVLSTRLIYVAQHGGGNIIPPKGIGEVKWVELDKAIETITFPHIRDQIRHISQHPETVWGGTQKRYQEGDNFKSEIVEAFYPLTKP